MPKLSIQHHLFRLWNIAIHLAILLIMGLNAFQFSKELQKIRAVKKVIPYSFSGLKFSGLEKVFKNVEIVGYYTDKDLDKDEHASQLAQAQLVLAPVILDVNNLDHEFLLFDCSSPEVAYAIIKKTGLLALKKNQYGIILAKRIK